MNLIEMMTKLSQENHSIRMNIKLSRLCNRRHDNVDYCFQTLVISIVQGVQKTMPLSFFFFIYKHVFLKKVIIPYFTLTYSNFIYTYI